MAESTKEYLIGVDLGGTKILAGVFDDKLNCLGRAKMSTKSQRGPEAVIERVARCVQDAIDECDLRPNKSAASASARPAPPTPRPDA